MSNFDLLMFPSIPLEKFIKFWKDHLHNKVDLISFPNAPRKLASVWSQIGTINYK